MNKKFLSHLIFHATARTSLARQDIQSTGARIHYNLMYSIQLAISTTAVQSA